MLKKSPDNQHLIYTWSNKCACVKQFTRWQQHDYADLMCSSSTMEKALVALAGWMNLWLVHRWTPTQEEQRTCAQRQLRRSCAASPASSLLTALTHSQVSMTKAIPQSNSGRSPICRCLSTCETQTREINGRQLEFLPISTAATESI